MIIVQQRQRDVRARAREAFDRPRIDGLIPASLKNNRRLREDRVERIVPKTVFVELDMQGPLGVVGVVEERKRAQAPPFFDTPGRQEMMSFLREHYRRREEDQPIDAGAETLGREDGDGAAQT